MMQPRLWAEAAQPHRLRPALVAEPQDRLGILRRRDLIVESFAERQDRLLRPIRTGLRAMDHRAIGTGRAGERFMAAWSDGYWWSNDGLRLHYRDYAADPKRPPITRIPGLTRNARDLQGVADRLAGIWPPD